MIEYIFPLSKNIASAVFHSELSKNGNLPELTHVGSKQIKLQNGFKPDKTEYRNGATENDELNIYFWFVEEKTEEELLVIEEIINEVILSNEPLS